jgi:hypothetical protein
VSSTETSIETTEIRSNAPIGAHGLDGGKLPGELFEAAAVAVTEAPVPARNTAVAAADSGFAVEVLDELAKRVRDGCQEIEKLARNALRASEELDRKALPIALDVGDALIEAQARIVEGSFKGWVHANCRKMSLRTVELYQQLARNRDVIEAEIARTGEMLSVRAARRLLSKPAKKDEDENAVEVIGGESAPTVPELPFVEMALARPAAEITAALEKRDPDWLLNVLPKTWVSALTHRVAKLPRVHDEPFLKASEMLRRALSSVKVANDPITTPAVAALHEKEALNVLRALNVVLAGVGIDEVTIVHQHAKECRRAKEPRRRRRRHRRSA